MYTSEVNFPAHFDHKTRKTRKQPSQQFVLQLTSENPGPKNKDFTIHQFN